MALKPLVSPRVGAFLTKSPGAKTSPLDLSSLLSAGGSTDRSLSTSQRDQPSPDQLRKRLANTLAKTNPEFAEDVEAIARGDLAAASLAVSQSVSGGKSRA